MKNLAFKKEKNQIAIQELKLVEITDSKNSKKYLHWFQNLIKSLSISNDLNLETFERIESKKLIHAIKNYFY